MLEKPNGNVAVAAEQPPDPHPIWRILMVNAEGHQLALDSASLRQTADVALPIPVSKHLLVLFPGQPVLATEGGLPHLY